MTSPGQDSSSTLLADLLSYIAHLSNKGAQSLPTINDLIKRAKLFSSANPTKAEQMEMLTTVALTMALASVLAFFLYKYWTKDEDTFETTRASNPLLASESAAKGKGNNDKKEKEKQQKKKEEQKKKKAAAAASTSADSKEESSPEAPAAPAKEQAKPAAAVSSPTKKTAVVEPVVKKEEAVPVQSSAPAARVATPEEPKKSAAPSTKKPKKAAKPVEEIENEEEFVEAKGKKNKKTEKKDAAPSSSASETTAPRHLSLKDLDTNKVVARLSSIDEIEVEYIEYLNNFFFETAANASRAVLESVRAQKQIEEGARALVAAKAEKTRVEQEVEGKRRAMEELAKKAAASSSIEMELRSKLVAASQETEKLRRDHAAAVAAASAAAEQAAALASAPVPENRTEELKQQLAADAASAAARIADLEEQLRTAKKAHETDVLQQKSREDAAVGQEVLLAESRQNAKAISQRLTELEQLKNSLELRVQEQAKQLEEAAKANTNAGADALSMQKMVEGLNEEVRRFEEAKKEQATVVAALAVKESELAQKTAALVQAEKLIGEIKKSTETSGNAAASQIETLNKRVAELEKSLAEEKKRAAEVHIPAAAPPAKDVEEIVELKKSAFLDAAPPAAANSEEVDALKKEVARLQEKNSDLRKHNHAMLDQVVDLEKKVMAKAAPAAAPSTSAAAADAAPVENGKAAPAAGGKKKGGKGGKAASAEPAAAAAAAEEKKDSKEEERVLAERRLVQTHIAKMIGATTPALEEGADAKAYEKWLKAVGASIKEAQQKAAKAAAAAAAPAPAAAASAGSSDDAEVEQLRVENESFRDALATLELELQTIEQLKTEREAAFARQIAELEKKHGKAH